MRRTSSTTSWTATAAALPRKIPAGSRPDRRSPSRVPSLASRAKLRWTARTTAKSTATQKRPAAACDHGARSGPRAKAKRARTTMANGATWLSTTRDRSSMRRSLPATRPRHATWTSPPGPIEAGSAPTAPPGRGRRHGALARRRDPRPATPPGRPAAATPRVRGRRASTVAPSATRLADDVAEQRPGLGVEGGVGFVEQPQRGAAGDEDGQGHAAGAGRRRADPPPCAGAGRPSPRRSRASSMPSTAAPAARTAKRTFSTTLNSS